MNAFAADGILYGAFPRQSSLPEPLSAPAERETFITRVTVDSTADPAVAVQSMKLVFRMIGCESEHRGLKITAKLPADPRSLELRRLVSGLFPAPDGAAFSGPLDVVDLETALSKVSLRASVEYLPDGSARVMNLFPDDIRQLT